jgi:hypothetical protein
MKMLAGLHLAVGAVVMSGCASPAIGPSATAGAEPLRVNDAASPLAYYEGARAQRIADAQCGPRGVRSTINDRYENGTWVFVGGCA